tara:strand:- start:659 stop:892 length:234 start_codon:yes stop_codon:yes gene_type:complete
MATCSLFGPTIGVNLADADKEMLESTEWTVPFGPAARYIYWVPDRRGHGRWTRYDFLALSLMIRGVLSPGSEALVDR